MLDPTGKYKFIGEQPFEVTNWDPAETQQVLTAAIAQEPEIDVIVSDFGPSLVGALPEFEKSGRSIPALADLRRQRPVLLLRGQQGREPGLQADDRRDRQRQRRGWRSSRPSRRRPAASRRPSTFQAPVFEDSVSSKPNGVQCEQDLPGDIYLSAQMPGEDQATLAEVGDRAARCGQRRRGRRSA